MAIGVESLKECKPCPWCGTNEMLVFKGIWGNFRIQCDGCGSSGPMGDILGDPTKSSIEKWNDYKIVDVIRIDPMQGPLTITFPQQQATPVRSTHEFCGIKMEVKDGEIFSATAVGGVDIPGINEYLSDEFPGYTAAMVDSGDICIFGKGRAIQIEGVDDYYDYEFIAES